MRTKNSGAGWLASPRRVSLEAARSLAVLALIAAAGLSPAWAQVTVTLTAPADGTTFAAPANITLTAIASAPKGYKISKVEFFNGSVLIGADAKSPFSVVWRDVQAGSYTLSAKATAVKKNQPEQAAISSEVVITVNGPNAPPVVSLTSPTSGTSFTAPANITISANAADSDGAISKVEFFHGGTNLIATVTSPPYSITWTGVPQGAYTLTARATDNLNATTSSDPVSVTVNPGVAQLFFIHTDHLNTPRLITDQAQQAVWRWDTTDPFGGNPPDENPGGLGIFTCNLRLPGQYFDKETNLHYNYFRDYDPAIGRYIQSDPIGVLGLLNQRQLLIEEYSVNEQLLVNLPETIRLGANTYGKRSGEMLLPYGLSLYAYVDGIPINRSDPLGLMGFGGSGSAGSVSKPVRKHTTPDICTMVPDIFPQSCKRHDSCYQCPPQKTRKECDIDFYWDMQNEHPWLPLVPFFYYMGVRTFGNPYYNTP